MFCTSLFFLLSFVLSFHLREMAYVFFFAFFFVMSHRAHFTYIYLILIVNCQHNSVLYNYNSNMAFFNDVMNLTIYYALSMPVVGNSFTIIPELFHLYMQDHGKYIHLNSLGST